MATKKYPLNEQVEKNGLDLKVTISFLKETESEMVLCSFNISNGHKSSEYRFVLGETTLEDVIDDFLEIEN